MSKRIVASQRAARKRTARTRATPVRPQQVSPSATRSGVRAVVSAKLQWEATVDLLPEIICLLDRERRVVRINRTVEQWRLSNVRAALGSDLHRLLHPQCTNSGCALLGAVDRAWARVERSAVAQEEVADPVLGRTLSINIRQAAGRKRGQRFDGRGYAVCVLADITALAAAQLQLRQVNEMLEARVLERTRDLEEANGELKQQIVRRESVERELLQSRNELSQLSVELMSAQEVERQSIARELHDAVGQSLSAVKYTLERSQKLLENPQLGDLTSALELALSHVHRTINDVRAISSSLRPPLLDDMGPASAIRDLCREWSAVYPHIRLTVQIQVQDDQVPANLTVSVFRIVQEGLNNIAKHANAANAEVVVRRRRRRLIVEVSDDGVGFALRRGRGLALGGSGLRGMRERAEHDGGQLRIRSAPGRGTRLAVTWGMSPTGRTASAPARPRTAA